MGNVYEELLPATYSAELQKKSVKIISADNKFAQILGFNKGTELINRQISLGGNINSETLLQLIPSRKIIHNIELILINPKTKKEIAIYGNIAFERPNLITGTAYEHSAQRELKEKAYRDPLTDLFNRHYFNDMIEKELERARRYKHSIQFIMIDINKFKEINDSLGHLVGDQALRAVAKILKKSFRKSDWVIRFGGDEFLIVLPEVEKDHEIKALLKKLDRITKKFNEQHKRKYSLSFSYGSSVFRFNSTVNLHTLMEEADRKMYADKKNKKNIL